MTNFEVRWKKMQTEGEANFVMRWGMFRVGLIFITVSLLTMVFDLLAHGLSFALINFLINVLFGIVGGAVLASVVWKWYEYSSREIDLS